MDLLLIHTLMNSSNIVLSAAARGLRNEFSEHKRRFEHFENIFVLIKIILISL